MGMSHNTVPAAEGYVLAYDHQYQQPQFQQPQFNNAQFHSINVQTATGVQAFHQQLPYGQPEHQTLLLVSPSSGDAVAPADFPKTSQQTSSVLMVTDFNSPQNVIQLPTGNIYQVPSYNGQIQSTQDVNMLGAMSPNLNFIQVPPTTMNLVQVPNTLLLANNNVFLCLQPEDSVSYQLPIETVTIHDNDTFALEEESYNQAIAAKNWHMDSDLANRALMALSQSPQGATLTSRAAESNSVGGLYN